MDKKCEFIKGIFVQRSCSKPSQNNCAKCNIVICNDHSHLLDQKKYCLSCYREENNRDDDEDYGMMIYEDNSFYYWYYLSQLEYHDQMSYQASSQDWQAADYNEWSESEDFSDGGEDFFDS